MKYEPKCYWTRCKEETSYMWYPSKNPSFPLWVCPTHFDLLTQIFDVEVLERHVGFTVVKAKPEEEI